MQSHQFVAKLHQNAPNRVLNFKKFPGVIPADPTHWGFCPQTLGRGEGGKGEEGRGRGGEKEEERGSEGGKEGEGVIHLLLPQAHQAVAACEYSSNGVELLVFCFCTLPITAAIGIVDRGHH